MLQLTCALGIKKLDFKKKFFFGKSLILKKKKSNLVHITGRQGYSSGLPCPPPGDLPIPLEAQMVKNLPAVWDTGV